MIHELRPPSAPRRTVSLGFADDDPVGVLIVDKLDEGPEFFHICCVA